MLSKPEMCWRLLLAKYGTKLWVQCWTFPLISWPTSAASIADVLQWQLYLDLQLRSVFVMFDDCFFVMDQQQQQQGEKQLAARWPAISKAEGWNLKPEDIGES